MNALQSQVYEDEFGVSKVEVEEMWVNIPEVFGKKAQAKVCLKKVLFSILLCHKWRIPLRFSEKLMALPRGVCLETWNGRRHKPLQPYLPKRPKNLKDKKRLSISHKTNISKARTHNNPLKGQCAEMRNSGLTVKEIAEYLGMALSTTYKYIAEADKSG